MSGPKAVSVTEEGEPDGFPIGTGWWPEAGFSGKTRLVISVPPDRLRPTHEALLRAMEGPLDVLYRQTVDRRDPRPEGAPPEDHVALAVPLDEVLAVLADCAGLVYHDARHELWLRGPRGEHVVLDGDGLLYAYPDDPTFRDALAEVPEGKVETLAERDYVMHVFHAELDSQEDALLKRLSPIAPRPKPG